MNKIENLLNSRGFDLDKLLHDDTVYQTTNIPQAADEIMSAIKNNRHIHVVADYDCDGVCSGINLYYLLSHFGADFTIRFPKKMSEGYGISEKIAAEIPDNSLVVTIDNGIAAVEVVDICNSRGMDVVILDHHIIRADGLVPNAKVVVDPHIFRDDDEFEHYCGAGLSYVLAKYLDVPKALLKKMNAVAALATVADVVPLVDDNRNIVKEGLRIINAREVDFPGLYSLIDRLKIKPNTNILAGVQEEGIAFQIAPCINAMGRIYDDGAEKVFNYLVHYDKYGEDGITDIIETNKYRKKLTAEQENKLEIEADMLMTPKTTCMVVYVPDLHEGIIGINAAKLCEKYGVPAIALTDSEQEGLLKGSARSTEDINMKKVLDDVSEYIFAYGGHAGAAGLTVEASKIQAFRKAINKATPKSHSGSSTTKYDIEISVDEINEVYDTLRKYAPYGEGFPQPIVKINQFNLIKKFGKFYRYIGDKGIAWNGTVCEAVSFELKDKYACLHAPLTMNIIGTIGWNDYQGGPQIMVNDIQEIVSSTPTTGFLI